MCHLSQKPAWVMRHVRSTYRLSLITLTSANTLIRQQMSRRSGHCRRYCRSTTSMAEVYASGRNRSRYCRSTTIMAGVWVSGRNLTSSVAIRPCASRKLRLRLMVMSPTVIMGLSVMSHDRRPAPARLIVMSRSAMRVPT